MPTSIDLTSSKLSNVNELQIFIEQLKRPSNNTQSTNQQLINENKRILDILKNIEIKIDKQLQIHRKNLLSVNPNHKVVFNKDQMKILQEKQTNNNKLITVLQKDYQNILNRKKQLEQGLQQKLIQKKHEIQDKINVIKNQIKKLKFDQKQSQKKLVKMYQHMSQADYIKEFNRMDQQLRIYSAKYVKIMTKYNKVTDQLAIASQVDPQFQIPQQIYNKQLEQKQQAQYKQYKSIVKLCTILSKRNDSQNNKANRIYTERLKQLEKTILHLTQLQKSIAFKQTEIIEGKKNIDLIKIKMENNQKIDKDILRMSNNTGMSKMKIGEYLRQKSYSSVKLTGYNSQKQYNSININQNNKLRSRGSSFAKLPAKIK